MKYLAMVVVIFMLTACGQQAVILPQSIDEEIDVCEVCYMMVPDNQFGAQIVTTAGEVYKFDDIGCMAMYINDNQPEGQAYTRDFYSNEWIDIESSWFAVSTGVETPMNYGYVSFGDRNNLEKFLAEYNGEEKNWSEILRNMEERDGYEEHKHAQY